MQKKILFSILILIFFQRAVFARQTDPQYFSAAMCETRCCSFTGGSTTSSINPDTGALNTSIAPSFCMIRNRNRNTYLTLSATTAYNGGTTNSIFDISTTKYIILTHSTSLPELPSITNIKSGSPSAASNPNAIAYQINDPASVPSRLNVSYDSTDKNWDLTLRKKGPTSSSITIPAGSALSETYSDDDEEGSYTATITISFN